ncbi:septum formation family protein [Microbacterium sp. SLBN-111]|uniref:DUF4190 domain-containing protein n=1 Tax=Microbacterium sp. SLBN-111 TaxID=3377733 RepID=UPI003C716B00
MATAELRLLLPLDQARDAVGSALAEQGFTVQPTATGSLDVSRGSLGTTIVAGAFAGQDMHVRFDVHFSPDAEGTLAAFEHSAVGGFFKGGAIGAAKAGDVVREAAHLAGVRLAQQGVLAGSPAPGAGPTADAPVYPAPPGAAGGVPPIPPAPGGSPDAVGLAPVRYGAPAPVPGAEQRTNTVAIVAIVLGFAVPIGGIIAGAVALAQVKRTGEKGRGLAIGGIVAGAVLTFLTIVAVVALVVFAALGAARSSSAGGSSDPFDGPGEAASAAPSDPGADEFLPLPVGSCLDDVPSGFITDKNLLDCASPHTYEVFGSFDVADGDYPGEAAFESQAFDTCKGKFTDFVGIAYDDSVLNYSYIYPTEPMWAQGDREIICLIFDPAGEVSGTLSNAQR